MTLMKPEDFLSRLPVRMSEREFRRRLRAAGLCYEHRRQIFLDEHQDCRATRGHQIVQACNRPCP